jgi:hypothetical protein
MPATDDRAHRSGSSKGFGGSKRLAQALTYTGPGPGRASHLLIALACSAADGLSRLRHTIFTSRSQAATHPSSTPTSLPIMSPAPRPSVQPHAASQRQEHAAAVIQACQDPASMGCLQLPAPVLT